MNEHIKEIKRRHDEEIFYTHYSNQKKVTVPMANNQWNTTDLILANKARHLENHHIKYDGLILQ